MRTDMQTGRSLNQLTAAALGVTYLAVGIIGFFVANDGFAHQDGGHIFGIFEVNPLHNVAHLVIGAALLLSARALASARWTNTAVGGAYLGLAIIGPFALGEEWNILALNAADNWLHLGSALLLLAVGLGADRGMTTRTTGGTSAGTMSSSRQSTTRSTQR